MTSDLRKAAEECPVIPMTSWSLSVRIEEWRKEFDSGEFAIGWDDFLCGRLVNLLSSFCTALSADRMAVREAVSLARRRAFEMAIARIEQFGVANAIDYLKAQRDQFTPTPAIDREDLIALLKNAKKLAEDREMREVGKLPVFDGYWLEAQADAIITHLTGGGK